MKGVRKQSSGKNRLKNGGANVVFASPQKLGNQKRWAGLPTYGVLYAFNAYLSPSFP